MKTDYLDRKKRQKAGPYVTNVCRKAVQNTNYRTEIWTGCYAQMTLMCIPVYSDIGLEIHEDTDQLIRIEQGMGLVKMGECKDRLDFQKEVCNGDTIFVPAGTWHTLFMMPGSKLAVIENRDTGIANSPRYYFEESERLLLIPSLSL